MTSIFLLGHGGYWAGDDNDSLTGKFTRVPTGMKVHFYALENQGFLPMNAVEILMTKAAAGDLECKAANECIPNYSFAPLEEVPWMQVFRRITLPPEARFIGGPDLGGSDRLCNTWGACTPASHKCGGLFEKLAGVTDLHLLSCRVGPLPVGVTTIAAPSGDFPNTEHIPGETAESPVHYQRIVELAVGFLELVEWDEEKRCFADPENAKAGSQFDALGEVDQAKVLAVDEVWGWSRVREARQRLKECQASSDLTRFVAWLKSQTEYEIDFYCADEALAPVVRQARS